MPLDREDYFEILRYLQRHLRERDPEAFEVVGEAYKHSDNPRLTLASYLDALIRVMAERSGGEHGRVLNLVNRYVRTAEGGPVRGITVELTAEERELYDVERIDLATLPDRSEFISALQRLRDDLLEDREFSGDDEQ